MMLAKEPFQRNREGRMNTRIRLSLVLVICAGIGATVGLQAREMYRWTDENGVVHFTDTKPAGRQDYQTSHVPDSAPASPAPAADPAAAAPNEPNEPNFAQQRREEIAQQKREARESRTQREAECAAWQAEVERLEPNRRVFFTNEAGETERMDDVERVNRVAELKQQIARNCN
jgi:type IV secretory pathway VirB10-like protein